MKIIEYRLEGAYKYKAFRPTIQYEDGTVTMLGYGKHNNVTNEFQVILDACKDKEKPDPKELFALAEICFRDEFVDNVTIRDDYALLINEHDKTKTQGVKSFSKDLPDCSCIGDICKIIHTNSNRDTLKKLHPVQKTRKIMKEFTRYEVKDGKAIQIVETKEVDELVFNELPIVDTDGKPVLVNGKP